jgi:hypothetical protein
LATHCAHCNRLLASTVSNPTIALSSGTYHDACYQVLGKVREEEQQRRAEARMEQEAKRLAKKLDARHARSERMKARWAAKRAASQA